MPCSLQTHTDSNPAKHRPTSRLVEGKKSATCPYDAVVQVCSVAINSMPWSCSGLLVQPMVAGSAECIKVSLGWNGKKWQWGLSDGENRSYSLLPTISLLLLSAWKKDGVLVTTDIESCVPQRDSRSDRSLEEDIEACIIRTAISRPVSLVCG